MNILITMSRMPFSTHLIRQLGATGHRVVTADTFSTAAGNHSRWVSSYHAVSPPRQSPRAFIRDIARIVEMEAIDLILPTFEEVFYLARFAEHLPSSARLFAPSFSVLAKLHHKANFLVWARELGLPSPRTTVVTSPEALRDAVASYGRFFARPVYTRGGVALCTNVGPMASTMHLEDCDPTPAQPWVVQEFVHGVERCSYSLVRAGEVLAHVAYCHPGTIGNAGGVSFESCDDPRTLEAARAIARASDYTGHLSLDFLVSQGDLLVSECNPRASAGVTLLTAQELSTALTDSKSGLVSAPAGRRAKISAGLLIDMIENWRHIPDNVNALLHGGPDIYASSDDIWPGIFQVLSFTHVVSYWRHAGRVQGLRDVVHAQFFDVCWDGEVMA